MFGDELFPLIIMVRLNHLRAPENLSYQPVQKAVHVVSIIV